MADVSDAQHPAARRDRRRPTISDVAALTGLSKATVSRALNDRDRVSAATRARVLATLEEIGYIRSHAAASLSTGRTGLLGLVIGANRNPTVLSAMHGALSAAGDYDVAVYVSETDERHDTIYGRLLASRAVDGVVHLFPGVTDEPFIRSLQRRGVPVVVVEPQAPFAEVSTVWPDSFHDGYMSTAHLLDGGHSRIAICGDVPGWGRERRYVEGYRRALADASIHVDPELVAEVGWTHEVGYRGHRRAGWRSTIRRPRRATAATLPRSGRWRVLATAALRLPEELAIVGYDDTEVARWVAPALTTLRDRRTMLVAEAFTILTAVLAGEVSAPVEREVRSELAIRESSASSSSAQPVASASFGQFERRPQLLRRAGGRRTEARLDDVDDMTGVLGGDHRRHAVTYPAHELHHVLEDVGLEEVPVPADDVGQHPHLVLPVGDRRSQSQLAAREVDRLAVEQHPVEHAGRAVERAGAELRIGLAGGGAVRDREQRVAEVDRAGSCCRRPR